MTDEAHEHAAAYMRGEEVSEGAKPHAAEESVDEADASESRDATVTGDRLSMRVKIDKKALSAPKANKLVIAGYEETARLRRSCDVTAPALRGFWLSGDESL